MNKFLFFLLFFIFLNQNIAFAQQQEKGSIKGVITDTKTNEITHLCRKIACVNTCLNYFSTYFNFQKKL
ncbi:MAG: hypothetical protein ACPG5B_02775 [Chitinophagales bacterium]